MIVAAAACRIGSACAADAPKAAILTAIRRDRRRSPPPRLVEVVDELDRLSTGAPEQHRSTGAALDASSTGFDMQHWISTGALDSSTGFDMQSVAVFELSDFHFHFGLPELPFRALFGVCDPYGWVPSAPRPAPGLCRRPTPRRPPNTLMSFVQSVRGHRASTALCSTVLPAAPPGTHRIHGADEVDAIPPSGRHTLPLPHGGPADRRPRPEGVERSIPGCSWRVTQDHPSPSTCPSGNLARAGPGHRPCPSWLGRSTTAHRIRSTSTRGQISDPRTIATWTCAIGTAPPARTTITPSWAGSRLSKTYVPRAIQGPVDAVHRGGSTSTPETGKRLALTVEKMARPRWPHDS